MTAAPCSAEAARRARIAAAAEAWIGTPYRHGASLKGAGADCLGLVRGVWREVVGREPERLPPYAPDWAEARGEERLLEGMRRWFPAAAAPGLGDVVLLRLRGRGPATHLGVIVSGGDAPRMVHAMSGRGVVASTLGPAWRRRVAAVFGFPE
jgi:NlpC/P60 family putative phage cell wall peptidase